MGISRRQFLGLSTACAGTAFIGCYVTRSSVLERIEIPAKNIGDKKIQIGYITDTHLCSWMTKDKCKELIRPLAAEKLDILLLGGDYILSGEGMIGGSISALLRTVKPKTPYETYSEMGDLIKELFSPLLVTFAVLGNHDNWSEPKMCGLAFKERGIELLKNERREIRLGNGKTIAIVGVDDYWTGYPKIPAPTKQKDPYTILLSHNPDAVIPLHTGGGAFDLALCGHTHGGQVKLPLIGPLMYNCSDLRVREGLYKGNNFSCYTSRGVGTVEVPIRVNCPPEVTLVTLTPA